jgi:hypothetical protein
LAGLVRKRTFFLFIVRLRAFLPREQTAFLMDGAPKIERTETFALGHRMLGGHLTESDDGNSGRRER